MKDRISRRSFMMLPALASLDVLAGARPNEHIFHYDHILGTSMDLAVWMPRGGSNAAAERIAKAALDEVGRLSEILNTRNPESEISRVDRGETRATSRELREVLQLYKVWERRTGGVLSARPLGPGTPLNVDALGKAYIIERAVAAARRAAPDIEGLLLNIGGDIVVCGRGQELGIADPARPYDNADPITHVHLRDGAVATSGPSARGAHFINGRTGVISQTACGTTVVSRDAVTANAVATAMCIMNTEEGIQLAERTSGTEALRFGPAGTGRDVRRTSGFSKMERFRRVRQAATSNWPMGYEISIAVTLKPIPAGGDAPYLAAWVEDGAGKLVRAIVLWGSKDRYKPELSSFWVITGGAESLIYKVSKVTRLPGSYKIVWNGLDNDGKPVPKGDYRIVIETNRYHGSYGKQAGMIACNDGPATTMLSGTSNFEPVTIQYGPKPTAA